VNEVHTVAASQADLSNLEASHQFRIGLVSLKRWARKLHNAALLLLRLRAGRSDEKPRCNGNGQQRESDSSHIASWRLADHR
jgi:hypothetical protein